jgi:hypothetical protein
VTQRRRSTLLCAIRFDRCRDEADERRAAAVNPFEQDVDAMRRRKLTLWRSLPGISPSSTFPSSIFPSAISPSVTTAGLRTIHPP